MRTSNRGLAGLGCTQTKSTHTPSKYCMGIIIVITIIIVIIISAVRVLQGIYRWITCSLYWAEAGRTVYTTALSWPAPWSEYVDDNNLSLGWRLTWWWSFGFVSRVLRRVLLGKEKRWVLGMSGPRQCWKWNVTILSCIIALAWNVSFCSNKGMVTHWWGFKCKVLM